MAQNEKLEPIIEFSGLNKNAIADDLINEIKVVSGSKTLVQEKALANLDVEYQEIPAVKDYFTSELNAPGDDDLKSVAAVGMEIAKRQGKLLPELEGLSAEEMAEIVDEGITQAKVAYQTGTGELDPTIATDYIIDTTAAVAGQAVTKTCETVGGALGATAGATIGAIFGPGGAAVGSLVGGAVGKLAGHVVGDIIVPGIKKVASVVKEVVHNAWEKVKEVGSAIVEGIGDFVSGVGDFFSSLFG